MYDDVQPIEEAFMMSKSIRMWCVGVVFYVGFPHDVQVDSDIFFMMSKSIQTRCVDVAFYVGILLDLQVDSLH
jgi:type IV secretory pathway VirB3-like protein